MHARFIRQLLHRSDVTIGQVHHVDIIAHASPIFGRIVVAKNRQRVTTSYRHLSDVRHQVIRDTLRIFTHIA
ncbi:hypothetical protein D3C85_1874800 [compost metagenome]